MRQRYLDWLNDISTHGEYHELSECLHNIIFNPIMEMDCNRAEDGIELRYNFGYEFDIPQPEIAAELDTRPCSVLEMMVALCLKMDGVVSDYEESLVPLYFEVMLDGLHLREYVDGNFYEEDVKERIETFMQRDYFEDGDGGLFYIDPPPGDMRKMEIWEQAMWFLSSRERRL